MILTWQISHHSHYTMKWCLMNQHTVEQTPWIVFVSDDHLSILSATRWSSVIEKEKTLRDLWFINSYVIFIPEIIWEKMKFVSHMPSYAASSGTDEVWLMVPMWRNYWNTTYVQCFITVREIPTKEIHMVFCSATLLCHSSSM